jgi:phasin family protein
MKNTQAPDFNKIKDTCKKNAEAMASTTQMIAESIQTLCRRSGEIAQDQMTASLNAMKDIASASNPEQAMTRQQEFIKSALEDGVSNTKEMIDLTSKSAMEIFTLIGSKVSDSISDSLCQVKK